MSKTRCLNGHELTGENLIPSGVKHGYRQCLTCQRQRCRDLAALIAAAHRHAGMQQKEYRSLYGQRARVARFVLAVTPRPDPTTNQLEF